jgi:hypothetical protein
MALRPLKQLEHSIIRPFTITAGQSAYLGRSVIFGTSDTMVQDSGGPSDLIIGVVRIDGQNAGYADVNGLINPALLTVPGVTTIEVVLLFSTILPMVVGTGGSTRGKKQILVASGVTDAPPVGNTTEVDIVGVALQTGAAGDQIGVGLSLISRLS